jgi:hypothetical protein
MRASVWLLCGVAVEIGACGGGAGSAAHQIRYVGALPACGLPEATLVRQADRFAFTPGDGVLVIDGVISADGRFSGKLNTQAPDKPPFLLTVQGHIEEEQVTLEYNTPRCHAAATLSRVHPAVL